MNVKFEYPRLQNLTEDHKPPTLVYVYQDGPILRISLSPYDSMKALVNVCEDGEIIVFRGDARATGFRVRIDDEVH